MERFLIHTWLFPTQQALLLPEIYSIVKFSLENRRQGNPHLNYPFCWQAETRLLPLPDWGQDLEQRIEGDTHKEDGAQCPHHCSKTADITEA